MIIFLTIVAASTSVISAITGMGGGIVLLSVMTFFIPVSVLIPIHGIVQLVSNSTRTFLLREYILKKLFIPFAIGIPFGVLISIYILKKIDSNQIPLLMISVLLLYSVFKPKKLPELKIPNWGFLIVGLIAGVLSLLIGAVGPFLAPFFLRSDLKRQNIVATKSSMQILTHVLKVPAFLFLNFNYLDYSTLIVLMSIAAIIGTKYGVKLLDNINESMFQKMFKLFLFLAAVRILYKVFVNY